MGVLTAKRISAEKRRPQVADLYLAGNRQNAIAKMFGVSNATITKDLQAIRRSWQSEYADRWNNVVSEQLAKIDHQERVAWDAWERSKQPIERTINDTSESKSVKGVDQKTDRAGDKSASQRVRNVTHSEQRDGDPRFLATVQWCIEQRLKIVGGYDSDRRANRKQQSEERWMTEIVEALRNKTIDPSEVRELFPDLADQLFAQAGVDVAGL